MKSIVIIAACVAAICLSTNSFAGQRCKITGDFHASIREEGMFTGRFIDYTIISAHFEGRDMPLPKEVKLGKNVKVVQNRYGEDICVFANKVGMEFLAEDKNYDRKYILPEQFSAPCYCQ